MTTSIGAAEPDSTAPASALRSAARGWHTVQLGALGFIGLCGVLQAGDSAAASSTWWPTAATDEVVALTTAQGSACGTLLGSHGGSLTLDVDGRSLVVPFDQLTSLAVVRRCR